jgi:hypothetical protein
MKKKLIFITLGLLLVFSLILPFISSGEKENPSGIPAPDIKQESLKYKEIWTQALSEFQEENQVYLEFFRKALLFALVSIIIYSLIDFTGLFKQFLIKVFLTLLFVFISFPQIQNFHLSNLSSTNPFLIVLFMLFPLFGIIFLLLTLSRYEELSLAVVMHYTGSIIFLLYTIYNYY